MSQESEGASPGLGWPAIALVVAMGENRAIGLDGDLPWRLRSDMKFFRSVTMGKPLVMGRRTFESLPRVLDGRLNIVLTRNGDVSAPGLVVVPDLATGLEEARTSRFGWLRTRAAWMRLVLCSSCSARHSWTVLCRHGHVASAGRPGWEPRHWRASG